MPVVESRTTAFALAALSVSFWGGCAVSEKVFVQDAVVTAPGPQLPVHLADNIVPGKLVVSPTIAFGRASKVNARIEGHSKVNAQGIYAVDTVHSGNGTVSFSPSGQNVQSFTGTNLHWTLPAIAAGVSLDLPISRSFALSGGVSYAASDGVDLWGGHLGLGLMSEGRITGFRFDAGILWTPALYDVGSVVETEYDPLFSSNYSRSVFYRDRDQGAEWGWYIGLTLNVRDSSWCVKPFCSMTIARTRLFSFYPDHLANLGPMFPATSDLPASTADGSVTVLTFTPGIAIPLGDPGTRILVGARWTLLPSLLDEESASMSPGTIIAPFVQIDVGL
jgi:hypothetical protein